MEVFLLTLGDHMSFSVVILAAGQGIRMRSTLPKVLQPLGGMPLLERILLTVRKLTPHRIIIVHGSQGEKLKQALAHFPDLFWVQQDQQLGTGHAVRQALPEVGEVEKVLILNGDVPLISEETLTEFLEKTKKYNIGLVTAKVENPEGLGRILRDDNNHIIGNIEEKDASPAEKQINEINTGIWNVSKTKLKSWLPQLTAYNAQKEYYLTDILQFAFKENEPIASLSPRANYEILGVNNKVELAALERQYQLLEAEKLMLQGATLLDPHRFDKRGEVTIGQDLTIDINVILEGKIELGNRLHIGPNVVIKNSIIHDDVHILANSHIDGAVIGSGCSIGPFARIRPGTALANDVKVGNFVEIKQTVVDSGSKINHLSYIGDATVGRNVNIGAGTITCNYDGKLKHKTTIGNEVFIGSDTQLIAPVTVGDGVLIGAGTTVTKDIPANQLIHNRIQHRSVDNWKQKNQANNTQDE